MVHDLREQLPFEGVVALFGQAISEEIMEVTRYQKLSNVAQSPVQYRLDPEQWVPLYLKWGGAVDGSKGEPKGERLIGIAHSHPTSHAFPSEADRAGWRYPELFMMILSFANADHVQGRAFVLQYDDCREIEFTILDTAFPME